MEVFEGALEQNLELRSAWLDETCGEDADLRREVEELLAADVAAEAVFGDGLRRSAVPVEPPAPERFGRYRVRGVVGHGGFGAVFEAWDPELERSVAIKTCAVDDEDLRRRFAREARIASRLDHPAITRVLDVGAEGGMPYLVQELLAGEDLRQVLAEHRGPFPVHRARDVLRQVAEALAYAHQRGVVHRDVKPGNLRCLPDGGVKLMDFGIAKLLTAPSDLTRQGAALGTAAYMAPEQVRGEAVDGRADVFSLGAVAWELLTGERPFAAETAAGTLYRVLEFPLPALRKVRPECPPALARLVEDCLAKKPSRRPSSEQVVERLTGEQGGPAKRRVLRWAIALPLLALPLIWALGPPPLGRVEVVSQPWGEVVAVEDGHGRAVDWRAALASDDAVTPVALDLASGEYRVTVRLASGEAGRCDARIAPGGSARCRVEGKPVDLDALLRSLEP